MLGGHCHLCSAIHIYIHLYLLRSELPIAALADVLPLLPISALADLLPSMTLAALSDVCCL